MSTDTIIQILPWTVGPARVNYTHMLTSSCIGWALTLLSEENLSFASTCQTIGLNTGYLMSYTVFLALNSEDFA